MPGDGFCAGATSLLRFDGMIDLGISDPHPLGGYSPKKEYVLPGQPRRGGSFHILYHTIAQYTAETTTMTDRLVSMETEDEPLSEETFKRIEEALEDLKQGRYYTEEEIEAELELG